MKFHLHCQWFVTRCLTPSQASTHYHLPMSLAIMFYPCTLLLLYRIITHLLKMLLIMCIYLRLLSLFNHFFKLWVILDKCLFLLLLSLIDIHPPIIPLIMHIFNMFWLLLSLTNQTTSVLTVLSMWSQFHLSNSSTTPKCSFFCCSSTYSLTT